MKEEIYIKIYIVLKHSKIRYDLKFISMDMKKINIISPKFIHNTTINVD